MNHSYSSLLARWVPRPLAALGLLLATAGAAHAQTPATFAPAATYGTGNTPQGIVLVDVNGDGRLDIINANSNSDNVGVLLGSAATPGTFPATATFYGSGGSFPVGISVGDVNGDGRPDVVVANLISGSISVLLNSATTPGTFLAATTYGNLNAARGIALGDVNGDGRLDIVSGSQAGPLYVLLNSATTPGTFGTPAAYAGSDGIDAVALGDVNGDGRLDIVASGFNSFISVFFNSATTPGTFLPVTPYSSGSTPRGITLGDVNGDGRLDIVTANQGSSNVGVLLNLPTTPGTFGPAALYPSVAAGPSSVMLADLNGDGRLDIATANYNSGSSNSNTVSTLLNSATTPGTFLGATTYSSGGSGPHDVALADLNADGKVDIATTNISSSTVGVLLNTTVFAAPTIATLSPSTGPVGTSVTVTGTNLTGATAVRFNGTAASSFAVNSATSLTAVVAAGTTTGLVSVTTPSGTATSPTNFVVRVAPTTVADAYSTPQSVTLTGNVLANDLGTNPVAILINRPTRGTLVLNPDGSFSYRPNAGFTGSDSFTYYACDPALPLLCGNPATVSITVTRVAPTTVADTYTTPAGVTLTGNVLSNDLGTNPRAILITRPANGVLALNPDGTFSYRPNAGFSGTDSFTYYACDPAIPLLCGIPATVSITVTRVAPTTVADAYTTPQNVTLTGNVLANDLGTNPRAILIMRPTNGVLVLNPDGSFSYRPAAGFVGTDSFIYYACDPSLPLLCGNPATVSLTVLPTSTTARAATQPAGATGAAAPIATPAQAAATTVGGATVALELALSGHPNPFADELQLNFTLPIAQAYSLAVYDAQGRLVQQLARGQAEAGQAQQLAVPTHTYAAGLYLVRLTTSTGTQLLKLIKR